MAHVDKVFSYEKLPKYPHMRPEDIRLWELFINQNPGRFFSVMYDVHVGDAEECDVDVLQNVKDAWCDLTRWKIDVVAEDENAFYIIEVKPNANAKALGQALSYAKLFLRDFSPPKKVIPVVLTDKAAKTTLAVAPDIGVKVWQMEP